MNHHARRDFRRTKIVATMGPASSSPERVRELIRAGVNVFRMNFSHGSADFHRHNLQAVREAAAEMQVSVGVLQDLQGPKIRVTTFAEGQVELLEGEEFTLTCNDDSPGDASRVGVTYTGLCDDVKPGDDLLLDDGRLRLRVKSVTEGRIVTEVTLGGVLSNNKGLNIPGSDLSLPALTEKDIADLRLGAELGVDWVAISFVRSAEDVREARRLLDEAGSTARLMAKIEKPSAVENFQDILAEVDGIMVARGDLGVELSPELVPAVQKSLIRQCRDAGKPVVTATQMLESMIHAPAPTRAEASDVANAIYDGTDAVMLSAETAVGDYPIEAVRMMDSIARTVETDTEYRRLQKSLTLKMAGTVADSVSHAACQVAEELDVQVIVCFSASGATAYRVSRFRNETPILAITTSEISYRQLSLVWGVAPFLSDEITDSADMVERANDCLATSHFAREGDRYVITAGVPFGVKGTTNLIRVEKFRQP